MSGGRSRRGASALAAGLLVTALVAAVAPWPASAESELWSLTASPLAVTTGAATTFSLTATNEDALEPVDSSREIGCLWVDVPVNFSVAGAEVTGSSTGDTWQASVSSNRVKVRTTSGGDRLGLLDTVSFTIDATALSSGSLAWEARAYRQQDCSGTGALLGVPPVVVVSGADVTPTPTPTSTPTPPPTPTPTPLLPLPTVSLTPLPTLDLLETPTPSPSPQASSTPQAEESGGPIPGVTPPPSEPSDGSPSPGPSLPPASEGADASPGTVGPDGGSTRPSRPTRIGQVVYQPRQANLGIGGLGVLDGAAVWFVPAAVLGVPGALIVLLVVLQVLGGAVWLPVVGRTLGEPEQGPRYRFRG